MPGAADHATVRAEVRAWLEANWDPELSLLEWRRLLANSGWGCPAWPREWCGRSLPAAAEVVAAEFARAGAVGPPVGVGMQLAAPTILQHGSDELKRRFIRPTVTGEIAWCQLFSEPGAGSDLAGLATRAEPDGGEWVAHGQKVWTTGAAHADFGLLLARTDWDVPKHKGITYFVLPMKQPAVEVRPLRQMNGHATFNEVFLDSARIPARNVIGEVGNGWAAALTTLAHERRLAPIFPAAASRPGPQSPVQARPRLAATAPGTSSGAALHGRALREAAAERVAAAEPHKWYPQRAGRADLVIQRAAAAGKSSDPVVRQEIARLITLAWSAEWASQRAAAARASGRPPGPEGSLGKLASSSIARAASRVHALIAGASGMLAGPGSPLEGTIAEIFLSVPAISIAGGTDEIQRNIIGERILGLPKEPDLSRDRPFRQVRTNVPPEPPGSGGQDSKA